MGFHGLGMLEFGNLGIWGVSGNYGYLRVPLKGYYKGFIRASLKASIRV